jgi:hypothetical protein
MASDDNATALDYISIYNTKGTQIAWAQRDLSHSLAEGSIIRYLRIE